MANSSSKKIVAENAQRMKVMDISFLSVNLFVFLIRFIVMRSSLTWTLSTMYLVTFVIECFVYLQLYKISRPRYDPQNGQLIDAGQDLSSSGLTSNMFDIVYITWAVHLFSLISNYVWALYLVIPGYALYKVWGLVKPFVMSSLKGNGEEEKELTEAEKKRLEKKEKKKERKQQRVKYVR